MDAEAIEKNSDWRVNALQLVYASRIPFEIASFASGPAAIVCLLQKKCRNKNILAAISFLGIFFKFYNNIAKVNIPDVVKENDQRSIDCVDYNPPSVIMSSIMIVTMTSFFITGCFRHRNSILYLQILSIYAVCSCTLICYLYVTSGIKRKQSSIFESKTEAFYVTPCLFDPFEKPLPVQLEYVLLYFPFTAVFMVYLVYIKKNGLPFTLMPQCRRAVSATECKLCTYIDDIFKGNLAFYGICFLVLRPLEFLYSFIYTTDIRDALPYIVHSSACLSICFTCIRVHFLKKPVKLVDKTDGLNIERWDQHHRNTVETLQFHDDKMAVKKHFIV